MKVILLQDIPKFGRAGEVKEASDGYARNFLLPRGLAKPANEQSLSKLSREKATADKKLAEDTARFQEMAKAIANTRLTIKTRVGESGKAFGAVTSAKIRDALAKEKIHIEKEWIDLPRPIKETGETEVKIKFPHGVESVLRVVIEPEQ